MFCAMKKDRNALSAFMQGIEDPHKFPSSRSTEQDCCKWFGVECNNITGPISPSLCDNMENQSESIQLDLSNNLFSGEFPDCWTLFKSLSHLSLGGNKLTGEIPDSVGHELSYKKYIMLLRIVDFSSNKLSGSILSELFRLCVAGRIPRSLRNLSFQGHLNLSYNDFKGMIPPLSTQLQSFLELPFSRTAHKRKGTIDPNRRKTEIVMSLEPLSSLAWQLALLLVSG
ncbi:hypothetical protein HN51_006062 [Arachis hypogaea]